MDIKLTSRPVKTSWKPKPNKWTKEAVEDLREMGKRWSSIDSRYLEQLELFVFPFDYHPCEYHKGLKVWTNSCMACWIAP